MARTVRMALDLTLYSIKTARPFITNTWNAAKSSLSATKASFILNNPVVSKAESLLGTATSTVESKLTSLRDSQLPKELKYLEEEIQRIKERISKSGSAACQIMQSNMRVAWPYMKVECAPPMTVALLQGSFGESLENTASGATNNLMNAIQTQITKMDAAVERKKREAEAAIIAAQEKAKAEEQKKKKAIEAKMTKEAAAAKQKDAKKAPEPDKKDDKKAATKGKKTPPVKKNEKKDPKKK